MMANGFKTRDEILKDILVKGNTNIEQDSFIPSNPGAYDQNKAYKLRVMKKKRQEKIARKVRYLFSNIVDTII